MFLFYNALDETRKTQITHNNFKLIDIKVELRDELYIYKLSYSTNVLICYIFGKKCGFVTFYTTQTTSHKVLFYTALDEKRKTLITYYNFKLIDIKVGTRDEFYINKLSFATNIVKCFIFCEKRGQVTFCTSRNTSHMSMFYNA